MLQEPMKLIEDEITKLNKAKTEADFYKVCDKIKARRNGQYPGYLSREVLDIYNNKFSNQLS
jgi:antibiotic biosynthesis monooxygenase (ABM) superfamily enzyme